MMTAGLILTVTFIVLLWLFSLRQILWKSIVFRNNGGHLRNRRVLLVVAHPDDESMFFCPAINHLISRGSRMDILCMSTGNAGGLGSIRKKELYKACAILDIPADQVHVIDDEGLQDGFGVAWDSVLLANIIKEKTMDLHTDMIICFDAFGVSGHCNHRDLHCGIMRMLRDEGEEIDAWELVSTNIGRKYCGPLDVWLSVLNAERCACHDDVCCLMNERPWRSVVAMAQHSSQWIWFRKLFVLFSAYTYINTLRRINKINA